MSGDNGKSPHILNASSNLLAICFIVLTSLKLLKQDQKSIIDNVTVVAIILFMTSCILSFLSIRSESERSDHYERAADVIFIIGLALLFVTTLLFSFDVIQ